MWIYCLFFFFSIEIKDLKYEWKNRPKKDEFNSMYLEKISDLTSWLFLFCLNSELYHVIHIMRFVPFFPSLSSVFNYYCPFLTSNHENVVVLLTLINHYSKKTCTFIKDPFLSTRGIKTHLKENDQLRILCKTGKKSTTA